MIDDLIPESPCGRHDDRLLVSLEKTLTRLPANACQMEKVVIEDLYGVPTGRIMLVAVDEE